MKFKRICLYFPLICILFSYKGKDESAGRNLPGNPNILFIAIDDLRPELGCYGNEHIKSPNIDMLAETGAVFTNHFVQVPTCGASRYSLLTGMLPKTKGHLSNEACHNFIAGKPEPEVPETFIHHLRRNGYYTVGIGKISHYVDGLLYGYTEPVGTEYELPHSWDEMLLNPGKWGTGWNAFFGYADGENRQSMNRQVKPYEMADVPDTGYPDGLITEQALEKLGELAKKEKPFFLGVGFFKPHLPFNAPKKYWDMYDEDEIPLSPNPYIPENVNKASLHGSGEFNGYQLGDEEATLDGPNSDSYAELQFEEDFLITNLELLGKIWGFLKYHHPEVGKGKYDWDDELFQFLPEYMNVNNIRQRDELLLRWIEKYGEVPECATCKETATDAYLKPDFSWVENGNMSAALKEKIKEIYQNRHQGTHYYIKKAYYDGNPEFLNEQPYSASFPDKNLRLLALYRYWNIIQYFFPYKYLTDKKWDEVLREYIFVFINAKTALEYQLAVLQLAGETNDTHARLFLAENETELLRGTRYAPLRTNEIDSLRGTKYAPFQVRFVENKLTVIDYFKPELKETAGLEIGDFITHINGKKIEYIMDSIKAYYPASNEAARMYYMATDLVRSNNNSIQIVYNSSGTIKQKKLTMYERSDLNMDEPKSKLSYDSIMIDNDSEFIGYITLETIKETEISHIKKSFINAKGIIIDIRNYPATFVPFALGEFFTSKRKPFAKFTTGNLNNPGEFYFSRNVPFLNNNTGNRISLNDYKTHKSENYFQGKLVVTVNEATISQAEYTAMAFRAGENTVIIGSQTQGADGNVSLIPLPGGIKAGISGIGVYYPDGTETQRVGIVPDIEISPTIEAIKEGRDEILEKALEIIRNN